MFIQIARPIMQKQPLVIPNKSCKTYFLLDNSKVYFTGDFDSGNLQKAEQLSSLTYRVTPGLDKTRNTTHKNFFHFKVFGFKHCTIKFIVTRAHLLQPFIRKDQSSEGYHPVVRRQPHKPFQKLHQDVKYNSNDQPELSFGFTFEAETWVEFAFTYPFAYEDNENLIKQLAKQCHNHHDIYFHEEVLTRTSETRKVHLLTITDRRNLTHQREAEVEGLFGEGQRPFKIDKPRVVISARVHPGEAPASHCMEGVLRFLLNQQDYRSYLLRKYFQFAIVPMVNPEGVFEGMFRYDLNGQNLNRMYLHADKRKHKSIWGIRQWLESLNRVDFFFDLHAHPSRKGFFIYGNALQEFLEQVEAQIFSKMLEYNCPYFQNLDCIYSEKAMMAKDKHDQYTKEGCARVHYLQKFGLIHSYTVECGYFAPTKLNRYPPQRQFLAGSDMMCTQEWQRISMKQYTPQSYMFMGKSLLVSILDIFHVNPYSRISTSDFKSVHSLRKFTAQRVYNEVERFRLIDSNCYKKIKNVANLIQQHYYLPRFKQYGLTVNQNYGMKHRKKAFSLNNRLYAKKQDKEKEKIPSNRFLSQQKHQMLVLGQHGLFDQQTTLNNSVEDLIKGKQFSAQLVSTPSLPQIHHKLHAPNLINFKKFRVAKSSSLQALKPKGIVDFQNRQNDQITLIVQARSPNQRFSHEKEDLKKMEKQIVDEIMHRKTKKQKKQPETDALLKIDRLSSFLKKQSRGRLPFIHLQPTDK